MPGDGIALDVADAAFVLPLGRCAVRRTSLRVHLGIPAEGVQSIVERTSRVCKVLADEGSALSTSTPCVVPPNCRHHFQGHVASRLALVQEHGDEGASEGARRRAEQMHLQRFVGREQILLDSGKNEDSRYLRRW